MQKVRYITFIFLLLASPYLWAQVAEKKVTIVTNETKFAEINPLAPAKAAFYSALLPGLGQAYNKKYWKIPIVYAALGTAIYAYSFNDIKYNEVRDAYKRRLEGFSDDQFSFLTDKERLVSAQKFYDRNRDISTFFIFGIYILNIIDANVDAHLKQFNVNDKLSLRPDIQTNDINYQKTMALTINYQF